MARLQDPLEPGVLSRKLMQRILKCLYELPKGLNLSPESKDLLAQIFVPDPRKRIDSYAIQNHPWSAPCMQGLWQSMLRGSNVETLL